MSKQALILHAWYNKPTDHWYPWLKKKLEKRDYKVLAPEIPTMNNKYPDLKKQLLFIENLKFLTPKTIVVGHSLGCVLGLRLAEKHIYQKLIQVAGWDFDDLYPNHKLYWKNKLNHKLVCKHVKEFVCITSDNDPYMTAFEVEEMNKRLKGKFVLIKDAGHFTEKFGITQIPQLLKYI